MAPPDQVNQHAEPGHRNREKPLYTDRLKDHPRDWKAIRDLLKVSPTHTLIIADYFRASKYFDDVVYDFVENNIYIKFKKTSYRYYKILKAKYQEMDDCICWVTIMLSTCF